MSAEGLRPVVYWIETSTILFWFVLSLQSSISSSETVSLFVQFETMDTASLVHLNLIFPTCRLFLLGCWGVTEAPLLWSEETWD